MDPKTDIGRLAAARIARAKDHIARAYRHEEGVVPWIVVDTPYWLFGEEPDSIPEDYFTSVESQFDHQMAMIRRHLEAVPDDDYIPFLFPWYGTVVVPSALGSGIEDYYAELFRGLSRRGVIVAAYPSPRIALSGGNYVECNRPVTGLSRRLRETLGRWSRMSP